MRFQCPECLKVISVDDELCGHDVECRGCSGIAGVITTIHVPNDHLSSYAMLGEFALGEECAVSDTEVTYTAIQTSLDRPVLVSVLKPELADDDASRDAFIAAVREQAAKPGPQPGEPLTVGEEYGILYKVVKAD